jgi:hypothetical protein
MFSGLNSILHCCPVDGGIFINYLEYYIDNKNVYGINPENIVIDVSGVDLNVLYISAYSSIYNEMNE